MMRARSTLLLDCDQSNNISCLIDEILHEHDNLSKPIEYQCHESKVKVTRVFLCFIV